MPIQKTAVVLLTKILCRSAHCREFSFAKEEKKPYGIKNLRKKQKKFVFFSQKLLTKIILHGIMLGVNKVKFRFHRAAERAQVNSHTPFGGSVCYGGNCARSFAARRFFMPKPTGS